MKTGVKQEKVKMAEYNTEDCRVCFDDQNNIFYSFKHNTTSIKIEGFNIMNFKQGGATHGFAK